MAETVHQEFAQFTAHLVATAAAPLDPASSDAPQVLPLPGRRLLLQRGDTELAVRDLDGGTPDVRFPAPWPRRYGSVTVSPGGDVAVFAGVHALRALDPAGAMLWELRHGCWSAAVCTEDHASFEEYAEDYYHSTADTGSAAFSPDGKLLWAHVRNHTDDGETQEEWLVLDPATGTVLGRTDTETVGSGSFHTPHPDPAYMGLTVGEGEEESPVLWGHWDGSELTYHRLVEEVMLAVSPSGEHFLTTDPGQWSLYLYRAADGIELRRLDAFAGGRDRVWWDYESAFPYDNAAIAGTEYHADNPRHWLIDPHTMAVRGRITYPFPIAGSPLSAGDGVWATVSKDHAAVHLWELRDYQA